MEARGKGEERGKNEGNTCFQTEKNELEPAGKPGEGWACFLLTLRPRVLGCSGLQPAPAPIPALSFVEAGSCRNLMPPLAPSSALSVPAPFPFEGRYSALWT